MILWTIMPEEVIFAGIAQDPDYQEMDYKGIRILAEKTGDSVYRIVRLLTTDPTAYLHDDLQPGKLIEMHPADI